MIKITLQEHEINDPEKGNCFYLHVEVADQGYAGWSDIVVTEHTFKAFSKEMKTFAKNLEGNPELKAGWGDEVYFQIHFERWKPTGLLWASGEIAMPANAKIDINPPCSHRFVFGFPVEPFQFDLFMTSLLGLIGRFEKEAVLETQI